MAVGMRLVVQSKVYRMQSMSFIYFIFSIKLLKQNFNSNYDRTDNIPRNVPVLHIVN